MSAIFMKRHRFSTINPDDIAGVRTNVNSVTFSRVSESEEDEIKKTEEKQADHEIDEEKIIGVDIDQIKRRALKKLRFAKEKRSLTKRLNKKWQKIKQHSGYKRLIPIILLIIYSILGAMMFSAIELPHADAKRQETLAKLDRNRRWTADEITTSLKLNNHSNSYQTILDILVKSDANNSLPAPETITWNIWGSLFFVGTLYTTIGLGNIYPETNLGYALTIVYAFFGIPLVLSILSDMAQLLNSWISKGWRVVVKRIPILTKHQQKHSHIPLPQSGMPITLCLFITMSWLLLCSGLFCIWEKNWTYFKAFYFFFISLSTIGLGDVVPDEPKLMICNFWLVIIGLSLVSMTLGVIQEHITLFLYRMMIEMQNECRARLSIGGDVEKKELLEKIWDKQPWYVRNFAPMFVSENENQTLQEFAGSAITDTAVKMGIIPAPPGYQPLQTLPTPAPQYVLPSVAIASAPLAMVSQNIQPTVHVHKTRMNEDKASSNVFEEMLFGNQSDKDSNKTPAIDSLYPGGNVVVKLPKTIFPLGQASIDEDAQQRLQKALKTRIASTQTPNDELLIITKKQYFSIGAQTDEYAEEMSIASSTSSSEFQSALETKTQDVTSFSSIPSVRYVTKGTQTVPITTRLSSQISTSNVEVQTANINSRNVEIQSVESEKQDVEIQCQLMSDEESQMSSRIRGRSRPDLLPHQGSDFLDKGVQTASTASMKEAEIQTSLIPAKSMEMQTEHPELESVETQTENGANSKLRLLQTHVSIDENDLEQENFLTVPKSKIGAWQYSAWVSNPERNNSLHSVPEEDEIEKEGSDEEIDDNELSDEDDNPDTDAPDTHPFSEENEPVSEGGVDLPAITVTNQDDDLWPKDQRRRRLAMPYMDDKILASMATQTEELITRRQSFPKDMFTNKIRDEKTVFPSNQPITSDKWDSNISITDNSERRRGSGILNWIMHRKRPARSNEKLNLIEQRHIAIQTDSESTRDIQIQTDESYLLKAKKFENLRSNRAGSLAVSVAPHLKRRLNRIAAEAQKSPPSSLISGSSEKKQKKPTPPRAQ